MVVENRIIIASQSRNSINLANLGGINLRPRLSLKQALAEDPEDEECRPWRRRILIFSPHSIVMAFKFSWASLLKIALLLLLIGAILVACFTLPVDKVLTLFYDFEYSFFFTVRLIPLI